MISKKNKRRYLIVPGVIIAIAFIADRLFPLPHPEQTSAFSQTVTAYDGTPLRSFPSRRHIWRNPITIEQVSPHYLEALIGYEDRSFWWHPGVNPWALIRAAGQWMFHWRIVSGGSTITMQVARIIDPCDRSIIGKLHQILRAFQLELHYSKRKILTIYLNYAPMGGVLEGVDAASRAYLSKSAANLSYSEAAMLAVLPQAPSRLRPDRYPYRAQKARNKLLNRMKDRWSANIIQDALTEPVFARGIKEPMIAPLLAQRLKSQYPGQLVITSTIDADIQSTVESLLLQRARSLPNHVSCAALVMDNKTLETRAYVGSADFHDRSRENYVDMVQAWRSPGSTLKPFLYGFAIDAGLIHSESLLSDVPQSFEGYQPGNFERTFSGAVSVSEALVRSLNVPAVQVLSHYGPERFVNQLEQGGLRLKFPRGASSNLSVILGGASTKLEYLVGEYSSLARNGIAGMPRFTNDVLKQEHRIMSPGAAFIIKNILESGGPSGWATLDRHNIGLAWKTGTSFDFRDAWAIGVTDHYTLGVWVGRPDGTPNPGFFGSNVAEPLLKDIYHILPRPTEPIAKSIPANVKQEEICWPLGNAAQSELSPLCATKRTAWVLDGVTPPTFADPLRSGEPIAHYTVDVQTGLRATRACTQRLLREEISPLWPTALEPWIDQKSRRLDPPAWMSGCMPPLNANLKMEITGLRSAEILHRTLAGDALQVSLGINGAKGRVRWLMNGMLLGDADAKKGWRIKFPHPGEYAITGLDDNEHYARIMVDVE